MDERAEAERDGGGEDQTAASFDMEVFAASLDGYRGALTISRAEREALIHGVEWISLELTARFAADALRERYRRLAQSRYGQTVTSDGPAWSTWP